MFKVGAAAKSTAPNTELYSGGFGLSPPITKMHDPLEVRAIYIANGKHAVAMVVVDAQGYFAATQDGPGISAARADAAKAVDGTPGPRMGAKDIVVQATHTHAGPTLEGIWGPTPARYLQLVHDQIVAAVAEAKRTATRAHIESGTVDAGRLDSSVIDTDSYPGWSNDGELHVIRATDAKSGRTIATYANVSVHGAHVQGDQQKMFSADYFGLARAQLDDKLGGVSLVTPGTLGREESVFEVTDFPTMEWFADIVTNYVMQALGTAQPITDDTVASAESNVQVVATNLALIALVDAWPLPESARQAEAQASGIYPINRANSPPYLTGNVIGTYATTLRVGPLAYASIPGEPFPEVSHAVRANTTGAKTITILSKAQDDLGYLYPAWVYPLVFAYGDDHNIFNVAPQAGDQFISAQLSGMRAVGFQANSYLPPQPVPFSPTRDLQPGLEALASPMVADAGPDGTASPVFEAVWSPAKGSSSVPSGKAHWDFGDGTTADTSFHATGQNLGQTVSPPPGDPRFAHTFRPGSYTVKVSAHDDSGATAEWALPIKVLPTPRLRVIARRVRGRRYHLTAGVTGGAAAVAWRWRFSDGTTRASHSGAHRFRGTKRPRATVMLTDATGTVTTASWRASARRR